MLESTMRALARGRISADDCRVLSVYINNRGDK